jgi:hypothetical protein
VSGSSCCSCWLRALQIPVACCWTGSGRRLIVVGALTMAAGSCCSRWPTHPARGDRAVLVGAGDALTFISVLGGHRLVPARRVPLMPS